MESVYPYLPAKSGTWQYPYPPLLTLANTWTQPQTQGSRFHYYAQQGNYTNLPNNSSVTWQFGGFGQFFIGGSTTSANIQVLNYNGSKNNRISLGVVPSASNPTIASGTVYQNTTNSYQTLVIPVYASTAGTAGSVAIALGTSSTPAAWGTQYVSGNTSSTACTLINLRVPPQWYYSVTVTDATIGTPAGIQE